MAAYRWLPICHVEQRGNRNAIEMQSIQYDKKRE